MQVSRLKTRILCLMIVNGVIFILVDLSRKLGQDKQSDKVLISDKRFWKKQVVSEAFWNRRQQRLDYFHNPLFTSPVYSNSTSANVEPVVSADWLNDTSPEDPCEPDHAVATQVKDYDSLPERFKDFLLYMRCRSYPMLIDQPGLCSEAPFLLLAVKSLAPHFDRRQAIREAWGRAGLVSGHKVVTVFLLGNAMTTDHFPDLKGMLQHEAGLHKDILQWDYRDSFFNLTVKEVLFLDWLADKCPTAHYIFKGDDDVFVNTRRILTYLSGLKGNKARDLFIGDVITGAGPHRDKKLKYYIPESLFMGQYPPYAGGGGYLYSGEVGLRLRNISQHISLYPIDDVYTGMCLERLGLAPEKHKGFKTFNIEEKYRDNACAYEGLMLVHSRTPQEVIHIWSWLQDPTLNCQTVTKDSK
ncbi:N-acetyllactosaminide beta-1,3-N-acetylglucosaminyltransferase 2a [Denticeps clupeoides]|uniref:N-acetyllactosaminide beta-1,3-N-acetylglucosaminyltransferase 2a n=1 Tax=Denticeps clupeoides TaxID=299321 RepID=UPI0010A2CC6A|nr:N-acetyllactosaminide beta-1,3-N-acetylglucosaminyltransferase 2-like [Denticeps clupeoides]XP_028830556.1 N-acetyllactosaminide beta-1,3-N-acetylglucosaminyltransferase 2-like [Denticeps clupeoides]XP_028830557.1 N-acetyllactosaminide beta-1,3-N-acetylglucosaminyltransferase 2-like [Denticeps clupeoides]